jgi:ATP-binding cassette subfamily B protein
MKAKKGAKLSSLKNTIYLIKVIFEASPSRIVWEILDILFEKSIEIFYTLFFLRFIIVSMQKGTSYAAIAVFVCAYFVLSFISKSINCHLDGRVRPCTNVSIQELLMDKVYQQAINVDLSCYENPEFYDKYTRANEEIVTRIPEILENFRLLISQIYSIIGYGIAVVVYEPILLPVLIVLYFISQVLQRRFIDARYELRNKTVAGRRKLDYLKRVIYQAEYAKDIRMTTILDPIWRNFHQAAQEMREVSKKYGKKAGIYRMISGLVSSLTVYLIIQSIIIVRFIVYKAYSFAALTTVLNASSGLTESFQSLSFTMGKIYENGMSIQNYRTFLEYESKMLNKKDGKQAVQGAHEIHIKNLSFKYDGAAKNVLSDIDFTINAGERIALVGHNGAGKSTLIKLLMRLYDPTQGAIELDGTDIRDYELDSYRSLFGTVFQDFKVFASSIIENILLDIPNDASKAKVTDALKECGIYNKIESLPKKTESILTKEFDADGIILSGGETQKVAVSRALVKESSIVILDEPSSALDPISEKELFDNMLKACKDKTVIFISHRLSSATMADRILMMEEGKIIEQGSHSELMKMDGQYAYMFKLQAKNYQDEIA